jgi:hypothetical protein
VTGQGRPAPNVMAIKYGVPITLDRERNLIFNMNVLEKCVEKYSKMDNILNAFNNLSAAKHIGTLMLNEDAEIWNEEHPNDQKPLITEKQLGRMLDSINKINEFQQKVRQAMLSGLPQNQVHEVEELAENIEKNLIAAQRKMKK